MAAVKPASSPLCRGGRRVRARRRTQLAASEVPPSAIDVRGALRDTWLTI
jgi:hypothetical protein